jgi:hypothetical protein
VIQRSYSNFSGGQNNFLGKFASPVTVDNGDIEALFYCEESINWEMAENGLIKYAGYQNVVTTVVSATVTGGYDWNGIVIKATGTKVYTVSGSAETEIYSGVTAGAHFQFTEWDNGSGTEILILCNGVDKPLVYDGSTCTTYSVTDPDNIWADARPQGAAVHRGRVFFWGDPTYPYRIYTPRSGTYLNFDNSTNEVDAFDVDAGFGGKLTGMKSLTDDLLVVYKERCIRRLMGTSPFGSVPDPFELRVVTNEFGCIAPRTITGNDIEHYFLAEDGMRQLKPIFNYGDIDPQQPTYPIQGIINNLNYTEEAIKNACAVFFKPTKQVWLSVPDGSSSTNNKIIQFDVISRGNDPRGTNDIKASTLFQYNRHVYHGDYTGKLYRHGDVYSFNGATNNATWVSKWIAHGGVSTRKIYRELHIYAEADGGGDLILQWQVSKRGIPTSYSTTQNVSATGNVWDTAVWDTATWASGETKILKIKNLGRGNAIKFKFLNNSTNQQLAIRQIDLFFDVLGTVKG